MFLNICAIQWALKSKFDLMVIHVITLHEADALISLEIL